MWSHTEITCDLTTHIWCSHVNIHAYDVHMWTLFPMRWGFVSFHETIAYYQTNRSYCYKNKQKQVSRSSRFIFHFGDSCAVWCASTNGAFRCSSTNRDSPVLLCPSMKGALWRAPMNWDWRAWRHIIAWNVNINFWPCFCCACRLATLVTGARIQCSWYYIGTEHMRMACTQPRYVLGLATSAGGFLEHQNTEPRKRITRS